MRDPRPVVARLARLACGVCVGLSIAGPADAGPTTYLALGDSITFGVGKDETASDGSNGDRGYVALHADYLAKSADGVRPTVLNLAISGEISASFYAQGTGLDGVGAAMRNTNSTGTPLPSQNALLMSNSPNPA